MLKLLIVEGGKFGQPNSFFQLFIFDDNSYEKKKKILVLTRHGHKKKTRAETLP